MGYLREKYTKTYFTGRNEDGSPAGYGIEENYDGSETSLRQFDVQILDKINFQNTNVLEIGFGRGESIRYLKNHGINSYIGIDFAEAAYEIAKESLDKLCLKNYTLYCDDILDFLKDKSEKINYSIDIVLMLDVVEHIPRYELSLILSFLKNFLSEKSLIVINTPVYRFDNDVLQNGIDERNYIDAIDQSDFIPETKGMHCNKYSIASLQEFMQKHEYLAITEGHVFANVKTHPNELPSYTDLHLPYATLWKNYFALKYPLKQEYIADHFEYAYNRKQNIELITCQGTYLQGIKVLGLKTAIDSFQDDGALDYLDKYIKHGDIVFDVGCYVGLSALFFAKKVGPTGRVICFEPNKYNLSRTKFNLSENPDLVDSIDLYGFGLSDTNTRSEMLLSDDIESGHSSASQLVKGGRIAIPQSELEDMGFFKESIKLKTLDAFVEETGIIPKLIKVDIEGAEVSFLKGGMSVIKKHKPIIFMELHNVFAACAVFQILKQLNYEFHILSEEWGNRVQIAALYDDNTPIGLSNMEVIEDLFKSYCSNKAKLYQENLETYAKNQRLLYQMSESELHKMKKICSDLSTSHATLEQIRSAERQDWEEREKMRVEEAEKLERTRLLWQDEYYNLLNCRSVRFIKYIKSIVSLIGIKRIWQTSK